MGWGWGTEGLLCLAQQGVREATTKEWHLESNRDLSKDKELARLGKNPAWEIHTGHRNVRRKGRSL